MVLYDHDPDIIRWGLHLLLPGGVVGGGAATDNSAHHHTQTTTSTPYSAYAPPLHHANGDSSNSTEINVEHVARDDAVNNDEIIAQALQEELSQIALAEASGASSADNNHSAVLTQQWFRPRTIHVASGMHPILKVNAAKYKSKAPGVFPFKSSCSLFLLHLKGHLQLLDRQRAGRNHLVHAQALEMTMSNMVRHA